MPRPPDAQFADPRLVALYDAFESDRPDLDVYAAMVDEFGARTVLDVGCGTGVLALMLADRAVEVTGVDPAEASLDVARAKPGAERVSWISGDATALPPIEVDLAIMTGNVAQVFVTDEDWLATLVGVRGALVPGGRFVFETRDPERRAWERWDRARTQSRVELDGIGVVTSWTDVIELAEGEVTFRTTYDFEADGATVVSHSTLRFRTREQLEASLADAGFVVDEVRDAPDRPGREFVYIARPAG